MRVLIADDDREVANVFSRFVESCGHQVSTVTSGGLDVLAAYDRFKPDVVMMDVMMPRFNGITVSHAILSRDPRAQLVLLSGKMSADHPFIATSGAMRFLPKPVPLSTIKALLDEIQPGTGTSIAE